MLNMELIIKDLIKSEAKTSEDLAVFKRRIAKKYKIQCPNNVIILKAYHKLTGKGRLKKNIRIENLLKTSPVRSLSGIVNVSVLTKPYPCPGKCLYCPSQKGTPKSYLNNEPAVMRAILNKYSPYGQVKMRIKSLEITGHPTDKIELRIIGGTWSYYPKKYQEWFIKKCFDACNQKISKNLKTAQKLNEKAKHRIIGLSVETRPDFINDSEIKKLRNYGVTMVELGVQTVYDDILKLNRREHDIKSTIEATRLLKDAGFKVLYQMMPNLLGSNLKKDGKMFEELFKNPDFKPDLLKIYPCALLKEAPLYKSWKSKKYKPYNEKQLISLLKSIKKTIPYYVRIQRITRDIPSNSIVFGGAKTSNLRQILATLSREEGWQCKCIRCREIRDNYNPKEKIYPVRNSPPQRPCGRASAGVISNGVYLFRENYKASEGREIFLSFENKNRTKLYSLLRLRITSKNEAIIREIHTYGQVVPVSLRHGSRQAQHRGLGKKLIKEVEKITKEEFKINKITIISGVGVRNYFRKLGYILDETYMVKKI